MSGKAECRQNCEGLATDQLMKWTDQRNRQSKETDQRNRLKKQTDQGNRLQKQTGYRNRQIRITDSQLLDEAMLEVVVKKGGNLNEDFYFIITSNSHRLHVNNY